MGEATLRALDAQAPKPKSKLCYEEQISTVCAPPGPKAGTPPLAQAHVTGCFQEKDADRVSTGIFAVAARESARGEEATAFHLTQRASDATTQGQGRQGTDAAMPATIPAGR